MDGVGLCSKNSWNQPGGQTCGFGGAVTTQVLPEHEMAGKVVLCPILLPCVEASAPSNQALVLAVVPEVTAVATACLYGQSEFAMVSVGRAAPERR